MIDIIKDFPCDIMEIVKKASEEGKKKLAIANKGVMFNIPNFYDGCKSYGIQPIIGCEFPLENGQSIMLFANSNEGYYNLIKLSSIACSVTGTFANPNISEKYIVLHENGLTENPDEVEEFEIIFSEPIFLENKFTDEYEIDDFYLYSESVFGLIKLLSENKIPSEKKKEYVKRLMYEINILRKKPFFVLYILIVRDYVKWINNNNFEPCIVRGAANGSLLLYCLGISDIDPIKNGLIFEIFVNQNRMSLPDIDIDVPIGCRTKIYKYLQRRYGKSCIGNVINVKPNGEYQGCNSSKVIISNKNLAETVPVFINEYGNLVSQYQGYVFEKHGIIEFDIFENISLSIVNDAEKEIPDFKIDEIPFDDKATFDLLGKGETYEIENSGCSLFQKLNLKKFKPNSIEDLAILYATEPYYEDILSLVIHNKANNIPCEPVCSCLTPIIEQTYGCFIFQEQFMQAIQIFTGCTLSEANHIRKILSKKNTRLYNECREDFTEKGVKQGHSEEECEKVFDYFDSIVGKMFPKGEAIAMAKLAYKVVYIQCHYPEIFERISQKYSRK